MLPSISSSLGPAEIAARAATHGRDVFLVAFIDAQSPRETGPFASPRLPLFETATLAPRLLAAYAEIRVASERPASAVLTPAFDDDAPRVLPTTIVEITVSRVFLASFSPAPDSFKCGTETPAPHLNLYSPCNFKSSRTN